ncbi:MAG: hypothetical protein ACE5O2_01290 [Armatimonadota bacterium]
MGGMTLVEVMVAVLILLVGIYAVVKGFPELNRAIGANKIRSERTRNMQGRLDSFVAHPFSLPFAIAIYPDPARTIDPAARPEADILNVVNDAYHVIGEPFYLSHYDPATGGGIGVPSPYVLKLGLPQLESAGPPPVWRIRVYEDVRLQPARTRGNPRLDEYDVTPADAVDGRINVVPLDPTDSDPNVRRVLVVDYVWMDSAGFAHFVHHELVPFMPSPPAPLPPGYYVAAAQLPGGVFAGLVPDQVRVFWRNYFRDVAAGGTDRDVYSPDPTYGTPLSFPVGAATVDAFGRPTDRRALAVDYDLALETPVPGDREGRTLARRIPIMVEDHQVPSTPDDWNDLSGDGRLDVGEPQYCSVQLEAGHFDDGSDTLTKPSPPLGIPNLQILAIDLTDGSVYRHNLDGSGAIEFNDEGYRRGVVWFAPGLHPAQSGHRLRFFYRTLSDDTVALYKAPAVFVNCITRPVRPPDDDYRLYIVDPGSADRTWANLDKSIIGFPEACAGQAVEVDYAFVDNDTGRLVTVSGELHVVSGSPGDRVPATGISEPGWTVGDACIIRLDHNPAAPDRPNVADAGVVAEIRAVRGVSLSGHVSWRHPKGRLKSLQASTYLRRPPAT